MSITPEVSAKTLTQLVATEIKVQMARGDVRQSQLARRLGKNEQWLSVRLRGIQPIDMNDLLAIARALDVEVHDLLPSREAAAQAIAQYLGQPVRSTDQPRRPTDNRPAARTADNRPPKGGRTAYLLRAGRRSQG